MIHVLLVILGVMVGLLIFCAVLNSIFSMIGDFANWLKKNP